MDVRIKALEAQVHKLQEEKTRTEVKVWQCYAIAECNKHRTHHYWKSVCT